MVKKKLLPALPLSTSSRDASIVANSPPSLVYRMARIILPVLAVLAVFDVAQAQRPGAASFVVPTAFPTSVFSSYYVKPAATVEPQPALYDPVLNITYPLNLTNPDTIPSVNTDPVYYPLAIANLTNATSEALVRLALTQLNSIIYESGGLSGNCSKCIAALSVGKVLAQTAPSFVPAASNQPLSLSLILVYFHISLSNKFHLFPMIRVPNSFVKQLLTSLEWCHSVSRQALRPIRLVKRLTVQAILVRFGLRCLHWPMSTVLMADISAAL